MVKATPEQYADRLINGVRNNVEKIRSGIDAVTDSPMEKAAGKKDKWLSGIQQAAADGKWERGLKRVSLSDWKEAFKGKGVQNMQTGIAAARGKMVEFAKEFIPFLERVQSEVNAMPDVTLDDRIEKMVQNARKIAQFKRS